jgi:stearoyl-CoA desaturase (Delta-9 desaturase)
MLSTITKQRILLLLLLLGAVFSIIYSVVTKSWLLMVSMLIYAGFLKVFAGNIALHRYFAHRSFKTGPLREKFLTYSTILLGTNSIFAWTIFHRHHHKYSDTKQDIHSPHVNGFWHNCFSFWWFNNNTFFIEKGCSVIPPRDLIRKPSVVFIDRHYYKIWTMLVFLTLLINWKITIFFLLAPAGCLQLFAGIMNTLGHWNIPGSYRNHDTDDNSYNNWILEILSLGEGFHNNHHHNPNNYTFSEKKYEFDFNGAIVKLLFDIDK